MDPLLEVPPDGQGALTKMIKDKKKKKKKKAKLSAKQKLLVSFQNLKKFINN